MIWATFIDILLFFLVTLVRRFSKRNFYPDVIILLLRQNYSFYALGLVEKFKRKIGWLQMNTVPIIFHWKFCLL